MACRRLGPLLLFSVAGLLTPSIARAQNTTCAGADFIVLNERVSQEIPSDGNLFFVTRVISGRSYSIMTWGSSPLVSVHLHIDLFADERCTIPAPGLRNQTPFVEPALEAERFEAAGHEGDQTSIISAPTTGYLFIRVRNDGGPGITARVLAIETTLFSPWWFTGGTNQAYVEVRNNMINATTATLTLYTKDGSVCGTSEVALNGNGNTAIAVNAVGSCEAAISGSAQIAFNGTPGGIAANLTTIDALNGTSFDSPFTPRMVWGTFGR